VKNNNKKSFAKQTGLQVAFILTADWMQRFEDCVTDTSICSQSGCHSIRFVKWMNFLMGVRPLLPIPRHSAKITLVRIALEWELSIDWGSNALWQGFPRSRRHMGLWWAYPPQTKL